MATRVVPLTVVIPSQTPVGAPVSFPLQFPSANVDRIDVRIPPGPKGSVGFSINNGGGNFIPQGDGNWIIADDQFIQWPLDGAPNNGNWQVVAYNTDYVSHTIYFFFNITDLASTVIPAGSGLIGV